MADYDRDRWHAVIMSAVRGRPRADTAWQLANLIVDAPEFRQAATPVCDHCGGSGLLNVEEADIDSDLGDPDVWENRATYCHECPAGAPWKEIGL